MLQVGLAFIAIGVFTVVFVALEYSAVVALIGLVGMAMCGCTGAILEALEKFKKG